MKKLLCFSLALLLSVAMVCPAFAAEDTFVPSITYKDYPTVVVGEDDVIGVVKDEEGNEIDKIYGPCLLVTPLARVNESELIPEASKQMLLYVYEELESGRMQLPAEKLSEDLEPDELIVRELFDATWLCEEHPVMVAPKGIVFEITFRVNIEADQELYVMTYKNDEWNPIVDVVNNGNGTVTCTFEDLCPVAFIVGEDKDVPPTGDLFNNEAAFWMIMMVCAGLALAAVIYFRRKEVQR